MSVLIRDNRVYLNLLFLLQCGLFMVFLSSLHSWFTWDLKHPVIVAACLLVFIFCFYENKISSKIKKKHLISFAILLMVELYAVRGGNINGLLGALLSSVLIFFVLILDDETKIKIFKFFTFSMAVVIAVSLIGWIMFLMKVDLPYKVAVYGDNQYRCNNYFFFLENIYERKLIPRFSSVFIEPGHLGMILSFLLFGNRFDFRKKTVIILFLGNLFTMSLAGYVLMMFSYIFFLMEKSRKSIVPIVLGVVLLYGIYFTVKTYNGGHNAINELIFKRVEIVDSDISGNNRFTEKMDNYFERMKGTDEFVWGIGSARYEALDFGPNAGYKVFIVQSGIFGTMLLFVFYYYQTYAYKGTLSWFLLIIYILSFLQRSYALWDVEILIFITALPFLNANMFSYKSLKAS